MFVIQAWWHECYECSQGAFGAWSLTGFVCLTEVVITALKSVECLEGNGFEVWFERCSSSSWTRKLSSRSRVVWVLWQEGLSRLDQSCNTHLCYREFAFEVEGSYDVKGLEGERPCACNEANAQLFALTESRVGVHRQTSWIQSCRSKGIWRQGIGSFARNSYVSTLCPVVICPYLCTSESRVLNLVLKMIS